MVPAKLKILRDYRKKRSKVNRIYLHRFWLKDCKRHYAVDKL